MKKPRYIATPLKKTYSNKTKINENNRRVGKFFFEKPL